MFLDNSVLHFNELVTDKKKTYQSHYMKDNNDLIMSLIWIQKGKKKAATLIEKDEDKTFSANYTAVCKIPRPKS